MLHTHSRWSPSLSPLSLGRVSCIHTRIHTLIHRLSSTQVTDDDYAWLTAEVAAIGGGNLPIVSVLEGGYNVEQLAKSVRVHLKALISS